MIRYPLIVPFGIPRNRDCIAFLDSRVARRNLAPRVVLLSNDGDCHCCVTLRSTARTKDRKRVRGRDFREDIVCTVHWNGTDALIERRGRCVLRVPLQKRIFENDDLVRRRGYDTRRPPRLTTAITTAVTTSIASAI